MPTNNRHPQPDPARCKVAAQWYIKRGWRPIPIEPPQNGRANTGKKPVTKKWPEQNIMLDQIEIHWPADFPRNIGIVCGTSKLVVLDFDTPEAFPIWATQHPDAVNTLSVKRNNAPDGRRHLYFHLEDGQLTPKQLSKATEGWGDLRSGKSQVVAPPSIHHSGGEYKFIDSSIPTLPWNNAYIPERYHQKNDDVTETTETTETTQDYRENRENKGNGMRRATDTQLTPEQAIELTLPDAPGQRNRRIFELARLLKFDCGLETKSMKELRPYVQAWHQKALSVITTESFIDTWTEFTVGYSKANFSATNNPVQSALSEAQANPPKCPEHYDDEKSRLLFGICFYLAKHGNGRFFLSPHDKTVMSALKCTPMIIYRLTKTMITDGFLEIVKLGIRRQSATRYAWKGT
jgi:hypothetical protein